MKDFILGIFVTLLLAFWIMIAVKGIITIKTAILVPVGIVIGFFITIWLVGYLWDK